MTKLEVRSPVGAGQIRTRRFDAWGKLEQAAGSVPTYGYTGREPDANGLIHYRARYYHPELGRFVSRDPLGLAAGINPYAYAGGNPVLFNDPDGMTARLAWNSASGYWSSATNAVGSFFSGLDVGGTAEQFGRKLAHDFVQNNQGSFGAQGWLANQMAQYAQGYDGSSANGQLAAGMAIGSTLLTPGGAFGKGGAAGKEVKAIGSIEYGALDSLGRPSGVTATITQDMLGTGTSAARNIIPPGYIPDAGLARGHLLGAQLGGSGSDLRNLVTLQQNPANSPAMRTFENQVRNAVGSGETIQYSVTPIYRGTNSIPCGVTICAQGSQGFSLGVSILNPPGF